MSVPREDYYSKIGTAFTEVSSRWRQEPWVEYLYANSTIENLDTYTEAGTYSTVYVLHWRLDEKKKTFVLLKWSEQIDKVYI